jgi:hypothetical protein
MPVALVHVASLPMRRAVVTIELSKIGRSHNYKVVIRILEVQEAVAL